MHVKFKQRRRQSAALHNTTANVELERQATIPSNHYKKLTIPIADNIDSGYRYMYIVIK